MNYTVYWRERVRRNLRTFLFNDLERGVDDTPLRRAAAEVDRLLSVDPASEGESRDRAERVVIVPPLSVLYEVFESERAVIIYGAVYHPRRQA